MSKDQRSRLQAQEPMLKTQSSTLALAEGGALACPGGLAHPAGPPTPPLAGRTLWALNV